MVNSDRVEQRVKSLTQVFARLGRQARFALAHVSQNIVPGEFRTAYRFPVGLERDVPRTFTFDDDPALIDTRHIPPTLALRTLGEAIMREDMRMNQAIHHGESRFLLLVDLSRSMLSRCFHGDKTTDFAIPAKSKLRALYLAVSTYMRIAEATGFVLRAMYLHGRAPEEQAISGPRNLTQQVLLSMSTRLIQTYRKAEASPASCEPFLLRGGLNLALTHRNRGVIVVVSDFLDPLEEYQSSLTQVMARHRVVLVDVATEQDRGFPVPGWRDVEAHRMPCREGARHVEQGTQPRLLDRATIDNWNQKRQVDRARLEILTRRFNADLVVCRDETYRACYSNAVKIFNRTS